MSIERELHVSTPYEFLHKHNIYIKAREISEVNYNFELSSIYFVI